MKHIEKEQLLIATYKAMPTTEIQRRLNSGQLTRVAAALARAELESRSSQEVNKPSATPDESSRTCPSQKGANFTPTPLKIIAFLLIGGLICCLIGYLLQSGGGVFMAIFFIVLPGIATVIGKSFPIFGFIVGWVLVSVPVWLGVYLWHSGAFVVKHGDFRPLGAILAYFFYFIVSAIAVTLGGGFIRGAKHQGNSSSGVTSTSSGVKSCETTS